MPYAESGQPEHWILLSIFFVLFAGYGLLQKPRSEQPCFACFLLGIGAVAVNGALLVAANRFGYGSYDLLGLLTLKQALVESSLIILGYCLIVHSIARFIRLVLTREALRASRMYL